MSDCDEFRCEQSAAASRASVLEAALQRIVVYCDNGTPRYNIRCLAERALRGEPLDLS